MKVFLSIVMLSVLAFAGCAHKPDLPKYGPVGTEREVIFWLQVYNPTPGVKRAYFTKPELWIVGLDGKKRPAVFDPQFAMLNKNGDWGGSYYPSKNGPVGNTTPSAQKFDTSNWDVNDKGVVTVIASEADYYYDLWHIRVEILPGEYILGSVVTQSQGDLRTRFGVDFWDKTLDGRDKSNRPKFTAWYFGDTWQKISLP